MTNYVKNQEDNIVFVNEATGMLMEMTPFTKKVIELVTRHDFDDLDADDKYGYWQMVADAVHERMVPAIKGTNWVADLMPKACDWMFFNPVQPVTVDWWNSFNDVHHHPISSEAELEELKSNAAKELVAWIDENY